MILIESIAVNVVAVLLTFAVFSTIALSVSLIMTRLIWRRNAAARLCCLRAAVVIPLVLAVVSPWLASEWCPIVRVPSIDDLGRYQQPISDVAGLIGREDQQGVGKGIPPVGSLEGKVVEADMAYDDSKFVTDSSLFSVGLTTGVILVAFVIWLVITGYGIMGTTLAIRRLRKLVRDAEPMEDSDVLVRFDMLRQQCQLGDKLTLMLSENSDGPLALGIFRPCIMVPSRWFSELSPSSQNAILAHEMAHVARRDPLWNVIVQLGLQIAWFQPLNLVARQRLKRDAELCADQYATTLLEHPTDLAWSLIDISERYMKLYLPSSNPPTLVANMAGHDTALEERIAALLSSHADVGMPRSSVKRIVGLLLIGYVVLLLLAPRFQTSRTDFFKDYTETFSMRRLIAKTGIVTGLFLSPINPAPAVSFAGQESESSKESKSSIPAELNNFRGMLIGKLVDRDIERGTFQVKVDYVSRVWENNGAGNPRVAVGKTFVVDGVTGKWLDQLLLLRPGETLEFEAQHRGGDTLTFPGEWLKKVAPFNAEAHPVPPEGFRGFSGVVTGTVVSKNAESHEITLRIDSIDKTSESSGAKEAGTGKGKSIVVAGFWGKMAQELDKLEKGDRIRTGVLHRVPKSDHFTVVEFVEELSGKEGLDSEKRITTSPSSSTKEKSKDGFPEGMEGFRGILRGELISRDVEKGELVFRAQRVTRTWKENRASDTECCRGQEFVVKRISGKWLDVLISLKPGDMIEVEAFHNGGKHLDFVAEWLKKVE